MSAPSVLEELHNEVSLTYGQWKIERIRHLVLVALDRERAALRTPASGEPDSSAVMQDDMAALMEALGMSSHARPSSPHRVMRDEIIPRARQLVASESPAELDQAHPEPLGDADALTDEIMVLIVARERIGDTLPVLRNAILHTLRATLRSAAAEPACECDCHGGYEGWISEPDDVEGRVRQFFEEDMSHATGFRRARIVFTRPRLDAMREERP